MSERLTKCECCSGRGYHRCACWPGDCICGYGDETCEECNGDGFVEPGDEDGFYCDESPAPTPKMVGPETSANSNSWHTACVNILWTRSETYELFNQIKGLAEAIERGEVDSTLASEAE